MSLNPVGRVIRLLRKKEQVSQKELGAAAGVTQPTISSWEREETRARVDQEAAIFRYLGISDQEVLHTFRALIDEKLSEVAKLEKRIGSGPLNALKELEESVESSELSVVKRESLKNFLAAIRADQQSVNRRISDFRIFFHAMTTEGEQAAGGDAEVDPDCNRNHLPGLLSPSFD